MTFWLGGMLVSGRDPVMRHAPTPTLSLSDIAKGHGHLQKIRDHQVSANASDLQSGLLVL